MGDGFQYHNNMKFSAKDKDNDLSPGDCANSHGGYGWWFKNCFQVILTRMTLDAVDCTLKPFPRWFRAYYEHQDLKDATMMLREKM